MLTTPAAARLRSSGQMEPIRRPRLSARTDCLRSGVERFDQARLPRQQLASWPIVECDHVTGGVTEHRRKHRLERDPQRRDIVVGHPASQAHLCLIHRGLGVHHGQHGPDAFYPLLSSMADDKADTLLPLEWNENSGPGSERTSLHGVGKSLIQRKRQRDTNVGARVAHSAGNPPTTHPLADHPPSYPGGPESHPAAPAE